MNVLQILFKARNVFAHIYLFDILLRFFLWIFEMRDEFREIGMFYIHSIVENSAPHLHIVFSFTFSVHYRLINAQFANCESWRGSAGSNMLGDTYIEFLKKTQKLRYLGIAITVFKDFKSLDHIFGRQQNHTHKVSIYVCGFSITWRSLPWFCLGFVAVGSDRNETNRI